MQTGIKDIVVIGGGLMGSSTAWHLSNEGENVLLIEQQDSDYSFGSSFGEARIARSLGLKNDIFSYLHNRSVSETEKLIRFLNEKEGANNHQIEDIYTTYPVTYIYYDSWKNTVERLIENQEDPFEYAASAEDAYQKFGISVPDSARVLRENKEHSGTMNPKELINKLHTGIQYHGNQIRYNHEVTFLNKKDDLYEIEIKNTDTGETQAIISNKVASAAGPYTGKLLKDIAPEFDQLISLKRVFLVFLKIKPEIYNSLSLAQQQKIREFYPVADFTSDLMFSMIEKVDSFGVPIIKIGGHLIRKDIQNLDQVWQKELTEKEKDWGIHTTLKYLQYLNLPLRETDLKFYDGYSCVYSLTDSEVPFVTNILDEKKQPDPNFILLAGMSGVGAKGSMMYGLIGANLLLQKEEESEMYQRTKTALGVERLLRQFGIDTDDSTEEEDFFKSWFVSDR